MPLTQLVFYLLFGAALFIGGGTVLHMMPPPIEQESAEKQELAEKKAEEETASAEPSGQPDAGEARSEREAPSPAADQPVRPSFDVVRVEQDGTGVIAGRAEPGWTVIVGTEKTEIARAVADRGGEWVVLLEEPIPPGEHAIGLHAVAPGANRGLVSEQRVAVSVAAPETSEETIVALSEPGRATRKMSSGAEEQEQEQKAQEEQEGKEEEETAPANRDDDDAASAETETAAADEAAAESSEGESAGAGDGAEERRSAERKRDMAAAETETPPKTAERTGADESAFPERTDTAADESEPAPAPADESKPAPAPEKVVAFTALDYERGDSGAGKLYLSGEATAGSRVVLYLNNERLGETVAGDHGRWSFKETETLSPDGAHSLRADAVQPDGQVASRAEVAFEPPPLPEPEVAAAPEASEAKPPREERQKEQEQERKRERQVAVVSEEHKEETVESRSAAADTEDAEAAVPDSGASGPDAAAREDSGTPQTGRTEQTGQAAQTEHDGRGDQAAEPVEKAEEKESLPFSQKRSIVVRRGDTLWHIARNRYGRGIRYTVIYQSNRDQIRDPDLIYPGQEFELPDR